MMISWYNCKEELLHEWQRPIEQAGLQILTTDDIHIDDSLLPPRKEKSGGEYDFSYFVTDNVDRVWVIGNHIQRRIPNPRTSDNWWNYFIIAPDKGSRWTYLAKTVVRILLASGAEGKPLCCKRLYRCEEMTLGRLSQILSKKLSNYRISITREGVEKKPNYEKDIFTKIIIKKGIIKCEVFTGPAISGNIKDLISFFAIDYKMMPIFHILRDKLINDIDKIMKGQGMIRII